MGGSLELPLVNPPISGPPRLRFAVDAFAPALQGYDALHADTCTLQNMCGISVVGGSDWERLKRYNLNEIYTPTIKPAGAAATAETPSPAVVLATPEAAKTDEAPGAVQEEPVVPVAVTANP